MKPCTFLLTLLAASTLLAGWACDPEYITQRHMKFFEGKTPEQIARFLAHPNGHPYGAAVRSLAAHGEKALPLIEKLLGDSHPWIRGGAVAALGAMYAVDPDSKEARTVTPELQRAADRVARLATDTHPAVQAALGSFMADTRLETDQTAKIIFIMAANPDPAVRFKTLHMARYWLKNPETMMKLSTIVSGISEGSTPNHWNWAHMILERYKDDARVRKAIPVMAAFLRNEANSAPHRGFFSDGAQNRALGIMKAQWDAEVERMPDVVAGVCRSFVRVPYKNYPGWVKTRKLAADLLMRLTPVSAKAVRATIAEEKKWLKEAEDPVFKRTVECDLEKGRAHVQRSIQALEEIAARLEKK
ncbi:hypothetical protein HQ560_22710 [bacterium]|nr:hypothetical protein [bacterium]